MAREKALASTHFKVLGNGERAERERARATAESLVMDAAESPPVNRLVDALSLFGIDQNEVRGSIADLSRDGRIAVSAGLVQAS